MSEPLTLSRDDVTVRTGHKIESWVCRWPGLSLEGRGPTIPAALRDLAANVESRALADLTRTVEGGKP